MGITVQIGNMETGRSLSCQYCPTELKETYGAEYGKLTVPGLSHKILQFTSGENPALELELEFNQLVNPKVSIAEQRRFLMHLLVPSRAAQGVTTGAPARTLFFWPEMFSMTCRLTKLEMTHTWFAPTGGSAMFKAKVSLEEARITRLTAEDVLNGGTVRSA